MIAGEAEAICGCEPRDRCIALIGVEVPRTLERALHETLFTNAGKAAEASDGFVVESYRDRLGEPSGFLTWRVHGGRRGAVSCRPAPPPWLRRSRGRNS